MLKNLLLNYFPQNYEGSNYQGAVIFLFAENGIILMKRSEKVPSHRGQLAFFGGHKEPHETDPLQTALREFNEESSLSSDLLSPLAYLPPLITHQNFILAPVLAELNCNLKELSQNLKSNGEWEKVIYVPFAYLSNPHNWVHGNFLGKENSHTVLYCPLLPSKIQILKSLNYQEDASNQNPFILWGITAKLIWSFLNSLSHLQVPPNSSIS